MRLTSIRDSRDAERHGQQQIVSVFGTFYQELYKKTHATNVSNDQVAGGKDDIRSSVQPVSLSRKMMSNAKH